MSLKIFRAFWGGYIPDYAKLAERGYFIMPSIGKKIITVANENQGFGVAKGTVKKLGKIYPSAQVCLFRKDTRALLWETTSKSDGSYSFRNLAIGLECFVVAFDPAQKYNAVIQGKVKIKDGRL
ncbi:hypothetical protein [Acinetobacter sp. ANC 3791]|uniref:hypothetical protein n=1 Tax=Acinetobacter sp. ANC 3791 TaxID=2529836 RepID=UPI0010396A8D|nr:hypothetical protein [Acinetobacter sp. ANC 3791]TCB83401.1 hypothetical protein E0H90_11775 [Acinetobacter sp. ANC 3791]